MNPLSALNSTARLVSLSGPSPLDSIDVVEFRAEEQLGRPFKFEIDLDATQHDLKASDLLGSWACATVLGASLGQRHFHGMITRVALTGASRQGKTYTLTLRPWLWFLSKRTDCRIFQNMTVPEILNSVFRAEGIERQAFFDHRAKLARDYPTREFCVQYRESDLDFVHRLMEEEGIYYYFEHENNRHTLVLADDPGSHAPVAAGTIDYLPDRSGRRSRSQITSWRSRVCASSGKASLESFDFEDPNKPLGAACHDPAGHDLDDFELFDYPGGYEQYDAGARLARLRLEAARAMASAAWGSTDLHSVTTGSTFILGDPDGALPADQRVEQLVVRTSIRVRDTQVGSGPVRRKPSYTCEFCAIPYSVQFRLPHQTPRPRIAGAQTAIVVGLAGEEIYTEEHGRVKVQFHWDRYGTSDENSSCWVRAAESWAGKSWGAQFLPRIGQEVVVEFLEGDPDRPIITGRVYNGLNKRPWDLPANKTVSGIKTDSSRDSEGFNELRFQDAAGKEQVLLRAQRDHDVYVGNCERHRVIGDRHMIVGWQDAETGEKGGSLYEKVWQDHHRTVVRDHVEHIHGNFTTVIGQGEAENGGSLRLVVEKDRVQEILGNDDLCVRGDRFEWTDGVHSNHVLKDRWESANGNSHVSSNKTLSLWGLMGLVAEGGDITLKVNDSNYIRITSQGITIRGSMVWLNSSAGMPAGSRPAIEFDGRQTSPPAGPIEPQAADSGTHNRAP